MNPPNADKMTEIKGTLTIQTSSPHPEKLMEAIEGFFDLKLLKGRWGIEWTWE